MGKVKIIYVMGVSGSGKSTIGKLLASQLACPFFDGDDFHPQGNIDKMASGQPLEDADREGWLERLNQLAKEKKDSGAIIACSALKKKYRALLSKGLDNKSVFVYLKGSFEEIKNRLQQRKNHFMPLALLHSQFETLEPPEQAITVSIENTPDQIVQTIQNQLN